MGAWLAGASPSIVADIGRDYPVELVDRIGDAGISTRWLRYTDDLSDQVLLRNEDGVREISFITPPKRSSLQAAVLPAEAHAAIHVCGMPARAQERVLKACRAAGAATSLDLFCTSDGDHMTWAKAVELARLADAFLPSCQDLGDAALSRAPEDVLVRLVAEVGRPTVIRLGKDGSIGLFGGHVVKLPAVPCRFVDATGAGDAYCGAFQTKWIETANLLTAMAWGAAAASVVIEGLGAIHALGGRRREDAKLRAHGIIELADCHDVAERLAESASLQNESTR